MTSPSEKSEALGELTDELYKGIEQMLNEAHQHMLQADSLVEHLPESILRNGALLARTDTLGGIGRALKGITRIRQGLDKQFKCRG